MTEETNQEEWFDVDTMDEIQFKISKVIERNETTAGIRQALMDWAHSRFSSEDRYRACMIIGETLARQAIAKGMATQMAEMMMKMHRNTHKIDVNDGTDVDAFLSDMKLLAAEYGVDPESVDSGMLAIQFNGPEHRAEFERKLNALKAKHGLGAEIEKMPYMGPQTEA